MPFLPMGFDTRTLCVLYGLFRLSPAVANDYQTNCKCQAPADDGADGTMVGDLFARQAVESKQTDNISGQTHGEETVVHVVERIGKPSTEQGEEYQCRR